jgi:hypothetical protein
VKTYTPTKFAPLLKSFHEELSDCLHELSGKPQSVPVYFYVGYQCIQAHRATAGYILLRDHLQIDGSKLLIRPAFEAMLRARAVHKNPDLLFRVAFGEYKQYRNLANNDPASLQIIEDQWSRFKNVYAQKFPNSPQLEEKITVEDLAKAGGIHSLYQSTYRLTCQFTHGALRAVTGNLDPFEAGDDHIMARCVCEAIRLLVACGGHAPNLDKLAAELVEMEKGP